MVVITEVSSSMREISSSEQVSNWKKFLFTQGIKAPRLIGI